MSVSASVSTNSGDVDCGRRQKGIMQKSRMAGQGDHDGVGVSRLKNTLARAGKGAKAEDRPVRSDDVPRPRTLSDDFTQQTELKR